MPLAPPTAAREARVFERHGIRWTDYYEWMKDVGRDNPRTIAYVEEENAYTDALMAHTTGFQERLYAEMKARIKETDLEVPVRDGKYLYYSRTVEGQNYPIFCRRRVVSAAPGEAPEEVTLDVNALAEGHEFFDVGVLQYSPDARYLAFSYDTTGAERYALRVKDLTTGELLADRVYPVRSLVWANDNRTIFYTRALDPEIESPTQLYRHVQGTDQAQDVMLLQEDDLAFGLWVQRTRDHRFILLGAGSNTTSEWRYLPADDPGGEFRMFAPREKDVEYYPQSREESFFIVTNDGGAKNFKVMRAPLERPGKENWSEYIAHRDSVYISGLDVFRDWLAVHERREGLEKLRVIDMRTSETHYVGFPEAAYAFTSGRNPEYEAVEYRITYTSLTTPRSVYDYGFATRELALRKRAEVLGDFDPARYTCERIFARGEDGARIPISLVYRADRFRRDGASPLLLYAYGAYGIDTNPYFTSLRLSLLDRGMVFALAHVRGGSEMGRDWYEQGRLRHKKNTFRDFVSCAEHLIGAGYTAADRLVAQGGSAGGMLMGVVANLRPDLFRVIIAEVPAVDEFTHMLDPKLSGVEFHYTEWGNPNVIEDFLYMRSWDAYQNLRSQRYPDMLVTAGLNDPRVPYWEPAKYVAKRRALERHGSHLLLKTEMAGHMGASGRYDFLREVAFQYAFILDRLGIDS